MDTNAILKALANDHRRMILEWLKDPRAHFPDPLPEHKDLPGVCAGHLHDKCGIAGPTISQYLNTLETAGLIKRTRHGRWTFVQRDEPGIARALASLNTAIGASDGQHSDPV